MHRLERQLGSAHFPAPSLRLGVHTTLRCAKPTEKKGGMVLRACLCALRLPSACAGVCASVRCPPTASWRLDLAIALRFIIVMAVTEFDVRARPTAASRWRPAHWRLIRDASEAWNFVVRSASWCRVVECPHCACGAAPMLRGAGAFLYLHF